MAAHGSSVCALFQGYVKGLVLSFVTGDGEEEGHCMAWERSRVEDCLWLLWLSCDLNRDRDGINGMQFRFGELVSRTPFGLILLLDV